MLPLLLLAMLHFGFVTFMMFVLPTPPEQHQQPPGSVEVASDGEVDNVRRIDEKGSARATQPEEPLLAFLGFLGVFIFFMFFVLVIILAWAWQLWFMTRMMFVYPLIVDRGHNFSDALRLSWAQTRIRFWELLALALLSYVIMMVGIQLMYVGLLVTVPIGLTVIASVYEERFNPGLMEGVAENSTSI